MFFQLIGSHVKTLKKEYGRLGGGGLESRGHGLFNLIKGEVSGCHSY